MVGISIEEDSSLEQFVKSEGDRMGYTVAVDTQGRTQALMQQAGVSGIPHAFVVSRDGKIVHRCELQLRQDMCSHSDADKLPTATYACVALRVFKFAGMCQSEPQALEQVQVANRSCRYSCVNQANTSNTSRLCQFGCFAAAIQRSRALKPQ